MSEKKPVIIVPTMTPKEMPPWTSASRKQPSGKRRLATVSCWAAFGLCAALGVFLSIGESAQTASVMSHVSSGFEYDETLGRLQYVSNMLPESAMVFLANGEEDVCVFCPASSAPLHAWSSKEPWLEYASSDVRSCLDGEIMTVVKNRNDEYTVRVLHDDGYESIYSGLSNLRVDDNALVKAGECIGFAADGVSFELRKDGLSILPVFAGE